MKLLGALALIIFGHANALASPAVAAPVIDCELRLATWCITDGAHEIRREFANDAIHNRMWTLRGSFSPESKLVILEPDGCESGRSDMLALAGFQRKFKWKGQFWDRAQIRMKADGTCDLAVLFPPEKRGATEWAFPAGFRLIRACSDANCENGAVAAIGDEIARRRKKIK